jgi:hypothetical protein
MIALKISPRELVKKWFGDRSLDEDALQDGVVEMIRHGWLPVFVPQPDEWERTTVFLPHRSQYSAIVRRLDGGGWGVIPRGLIESRTKCPISGMGTGLILSSIGISIVRVEGFRVVIRATTPNLALLAHSARIHPMKNISTAQLILMATGIQAPRTPWSDSLLLRVTKAFGELSVDVPGVLAGKRDSVVQSRWMFPPAPPLPPAAPWVPSEPPFPAAPYDYDPNTPPF